MASRSKLDDTVCYSTGIHLPHLSHGNDKDDYHSSRVVEQVAC